jgi:hypothetical protein
MITQKILTFNGVEIWRAMFYPTGHQARLIYSVYSSSIERIQELWDDLAMGRDVEAVEGKFCWRLEESEEQ